MKETKPKLNYKKIVPLVADSITEKPATIDIDVKPKNTLHKLLIKYKIMPAKRQFEIKPQRVINVARIAGRAIPMSEELEINQKDRVGTFMKLMHNHSKDIIYIVACVIQNDHREPTKKMLQIVQNEFEVQDLEKALIVGVTNYNINSFISSIALIAGIEALNLKASPQDE